MKAVREWADKWLGEPKKQYYDGQWVSGTGKEWAVKNPANGSLLCHFGLAGEDQIAEAAHRAHLVFKAKVWVKTSRMDKAGKLRQIARLIRDNIDKLATLETLANGKLYRESLVDDIPSCADIFDYYAGWVDKYYGVTCPVDAGSLNYTLIEPVGVCGLIAPWNFPLYQACLKIAPALAMGNSVIIKPSEFTPLTALYLIELIDKFIDMPPGVINLLVTDGPTANSMTLSNDIDKISFTGSTNIGKKIVRNAGESNLKAVTLELGGKSPCIFFADTPDLAGAIDRAFTVMFSHKGEKCSEPTRFIIHHDIYDKVVAALVEKATAVRCGDPFHAESTQGAQCNAGQFAKILHYIEIGKSEAELVAGGYADTDGETAWVSLSGRRYLPM